MKKLELKIPPPVVALVIAILMWGIAQVTPTVDMGRNTGFTLFTVFVVAGFLISVLGAGHFRRVGTSTDPRKPEIASQLVQGGVFKYSRNPMYLGIVLVLIGWASYLAAPAALLGPILAIWYLTRFQIIPEERILNEKFGEIYTEFKKEVRRWI